MKLEFCSLSSGSSGNCYYLGNEFHGILIDAGISARAIKNFLKDINISMHQIMGVLVTHNHNDHIKSLQTLACKYHFPIYTTDIVWENILKHPFQQKIGKDCVKMIKLFQKNTVAGFEFEAFPVSHDTPETVGFHICAGSRRVTIVTDLGYICENAAKYIKLANFLVIESNYDKDMLENGSYPYYLKNRILSKSGHLDNHETSTFLSEYMNPDLSHVCLAHLSKNNNSPEKALETLQKVFNEKGKKINEKTKILVLNRSIPSELFQL